MNKTVNNTTSATGRIGSGRFAHKNLRPIDRTWPFLGLTYFRSYKCNKTRIPCILARSGKRTLPTCDWFRADGSHILPSLYPNLYHIILLALISHFIIGVHHPAIVREIPHLSRIPIFLLERSANVVSHTFPHFPQSMLTPMLHSLSPLSSMPSSS